MRLFMQYLLVTLVVVGCVSIPNTFDANINVTIQHVYEDAESVEGYVENRTAKAPTVTTTDGNSVGLVGTSDPLESMSARNKDIQAAKTAGAIGENDEGYLEFVGTDRSQESRYLLLILAENDDREALYEGIAKAENIPVSEVQKVYAEVWKD